LTTDLFDATVGNLAWTYAELADALEGAHVERLDGGLVSVSDEAHPMANFALIVEPSAALLSHVRRSAAFRPVFNVYWPIRVGEARPQPGGLTEVWDLSILAHPLLEPRADTGDAAALRRVPRDERTEVAAFMVEQFFSASRRNYRGVVAQATARSDLELYALPNAVPTRNAPYDAALLLGRTNESVGLYNLCVRRSLRGRGIGRACVRAVLDMAAEAGLPCILQCENRLRDYYVGQGFQDVGTLVILNAR
jgi:GNAT superfamily N-acetyltransferase